MLSAIIARDQFTAVVNNEVFTFTSSHPHYSPLLDAIKANDTEKFLELASLNESSVAEELEKYGDVTINGSEISYKGLVISNSLTKRMIEMKSEGFSIDHMVKFLENLMQNPSRTSIYELFDFMENKHIPITEDGCFLSYKAVRPHSGQEFKDEFGRTVKSGDLVDKYKGTTRNNIGDVIEIPRNHVDDNRDHECSYGYHTGGLDYVTKSYHSHGDVVVLTKTNPKDVVAVPRDYNAQKLRTCRYEVLSIYKTPLNKPVYTEDDEYEFDDEYSYGDDFVEEYIPVDINDLTITDEISFAYEGKIRSGMVDALDQNYVQIILGEEDPSYDGAVSYRKFSKSQITDLKLKIE